MNGKKVKERVSAKIAACCLSGAIVIDTAGVQPTPQAKPAVTDFGLKPYSRT